jgi:hypothetical protein
MSKHIFSKIAKIGEEVRSAEPVKVELGVQEDLQDLIFKLDSSTTNLSNLSNLVNKKINEYNAIAKELVNGANLADSLYSETLSTVRSSEAYLKNLSVKLKELGMSFNDFPRASILDKKLDEMGRVLDGITAIKNVNPITINKKV